MENKEVVTEPIVDNTEKSEEMIPQSQVGGLIAKESKAAVEKLLKELGVEDFKSAKDGLNKLKEIQESQKTEAEKIAEENSLLKTKLSEYESEKKSRQIEDSIKEVLKSMEIDTKYAKTIEKLTDLNDIEEITPENIKSLVEKTVNEELPMLINGEAVKVGAEKTEVKQTSGVVNYLDEKYKNNPYYKK